MKILLAVDGSKNSMDAVESLIAHSGWYRESPSVELVTVRLPVPKLPNLSKVISKKDIQRYYDEEGEASLARAAQRLAEAAISFKKRILVGQIADSISKHANRAGCDLILVGTRGMSAVANALLGSTATKLLHIARVPVLLVR